MPAMFDHEKLEVYQLELELISWVGELLAELSAAGVASVAAARDYLDRASLSCLLNTAEGNGKRARQVRAKFFDDARGSATECAACLDALVAKSAGSAERVLAGKHMLRRIVQMLTKLVQRYEGVAEAEAEYGRSAAEGKRIEDEDEDEDEDDGERQ